MYIIYSRISCWWTVYYHL